MQSLAELNKQNRLFWIEQGELFRERMACDAIRGAALDMLRWQQVRGLPPKQQTTIEKALEAAEFAR
jgi:hypothetical protein